MSVASSTLDSIDAFWFESGPPDIRVLLTDYLEDDSQMTDDEKYDRLTMLLRDTYASQSELQRMRVELGNKLSESLEHLKVGNGTPGLYALDKRIDRIERAAEPRELLRRHVASVAIAVTLGLFITWGYNRITTQPVVKEVATDKVTIDALKVQNDEMRLQLEQIKQSIQRPATIPPPSHKRQIAKTKPERSSKLEGDGSLITDRKLPVLPEAMFSSMQFPNISQYRN